MTDTYAVELGGVAAAVVTFFIVIIRIILVLRREALLLHSDVLFSNDRYEDAALIRRRATKSSLSAMLSSTPHNDWRADIESVQVTTPPNTNRQSVFESSCCDRIIFSASRKNSISSEMPTNQQPLQSS